MLRYTRLTCLYVVLQCIQQRVSFIVARPFARRMAVCIERTTCSTRLLLTTRPTCQPRSHEWIPIQTECTCIEPRYTCSLKACSYRCNRTELLSRRCERTFNKEAKPARNSPETCQSCGCYRHGQQVLCWGGECLKFMTLSPSVYRHQLWCLSGG